LNTNAQCTNGRYFIAELDESDGTITKYSPDIVVINNIEADHPDFYTDGLDSILKVFAEFLDNLPQDTIVLVNNDCENVRKLISGRKCITYSLSSPPHPNPLPQGEGTQYVAENIVYTPDYITFDVNGTRLKIILRGEHNVYNALAVFASLCEAGIEPDVMKEHFAAFTGMGRRFEKVAEFDDITVYDDYAHHPTEIRVTLNAAKGLKPSPEALNSPLGSLSASTLSHRERVTGNVVAVFQPHRYTRFKNLWEDFLNAFEDADRVVVTDVYSASEEPLEGVDSAAFAKELSKCVPAEHISGNMTELARKLLPSLKPHDIVIGLGAGTITYLGKEIKEAVVAGRV
ncbi:MAG: hypothetical protein LBJ74_05065, partial [Heliobacteriaceae bacterium]|nr:hypothetical protein [Heliobacteriaceae bacterium]